MATDPIHQGRRNAQRASKFPPGTVCAFCGESEVVALHPTPIHVLEGHHFLGRAHDRSAVVYLCLTHHALVTARQRDDGVPLTEQTNLLEREIAKHLAAASFLRSSADSHDRSARALREAVAALDAAYPDWRSLPPITDTP